MATTTPSPFQKARSEQRVETRRKKQLSRLISNFKALVERAIALAKRGDALAAKLRTYDGDPARFNARVASDTSAWWAMVIFAAAIALYVIGEFFASADVAEFLAHQIAQLFVHASGPATETPVWLRRAAGVGFVVIMLGLTLLLKYVTDYYASDLRQRRSSVEAGDGATYWKFTTGLMATCSARVLYLGAVLWLYTWLYGFAEQRAAYMAAIASERNAAEMVDVQLALHDGTVQAAQANPSATPTAQNMEGDSRKLAYATAVIYACLFGIHCLIIAMPTHGFGRELPLANFKREAAQRRLDALRLEEDRLLRDLLTRISAAQGEEKNALVMEAQPVRARIEAAAASQPVQQNGPPEPGARSATDTDPDDDTAAAPAATPPSGPPTADGNHAPGPGSNLYEMLWGAEPTDESTQGERA